MSREHDDSNPFAAPRTTPGFGGDIPSTDALASRWLRLVAKLIDGTVVVALVLVATVIVAVPWTLSKKSDDERLAALMLGSFLLVGALLVLALVAYQSWLLTTRGQTIGKRLCRIRIVTHDSGELPGFARAVLVRGFVTWLIGQLFGLYPLIDTLFIFGNERRCLHDLMAGTVVVNE